MTHHLLKVDERVALDGEESRGSNRSQSDCNRGPKLPGNRVRVNGNALDSLDRDITVLDGLLMERGRDSQRDRTSRKSTWPKGEIRAVTLQLGDTHVTENDASNATYCRAMIFQSMLF